jgi:aminopeptidase N
MRTLRLAAILAVCLPMTAHAAETSGRVVLPADVAPTRYDLSIVPDAAHMTFTGTVNIALDVKAATKTIELNAADLTFNTVTLDGHAAPKAVFDDTEGTATFAVCSIPSSQKWDGMRNRARIPT